MLQYQIPNMVSFPLNDTSTSTPSATATLSSTSHTINTNSTNNTNNSLNYNIQQASIKQEDGDIPSGYSVHIKASNNANSNSTYIPTGETSPYNPSVPTLSSSESLSAFNLFDGLNNFPIIGPPSQSGTSGSTSLSDALFNTNLMSPPPADPLAGSNNIVTDETVAEIVSNTSVPEFLYQLTKMLTDEHRDIIEWSNGKIEVHNPTKLEKEVLNQYFRHSKYASFQRQLNYFGFRKLAGKGKMAPCSYVNENATSDLRSLLRMKRKTSATTKDGTPVSEGGIITAAPSDQAHITKATNGRSANKKPSKRARTTTVRQQPTLNPSVPASCISSKLKIAKGSGIKHQLNGYLAGSKASQDNITSSSTFSRQPINNPLVPDPMANMDPASLAKSAVGKGVTHQYLSNKSTGAFGAINSITNGIPTDSSNKFTFLDPSQLGMGMENCLSELQANYRNSLNEANSRPGGSTNAKNMDNSNHYYSSLTRESSLVDLAIIPSLNTSSSQSNFLYMNNSSNEKSLESDYGMTFIDFPDDIDPNTSGN